MDFGIVAYHLAGGIDENGIVGQDAIAIDDHAGEDGGLMLASELGKESEGGGLVGGFGHFGEIHAESGGEHLGEDDERVGIDGVVR